MLWIFVFIFFVHEVFFMGKIKPAGIIGRWIRYRGFGKSIWRECIWDVRVILGKMRRLVSKYWLKCLTRIKSVVPGPLKLAKGYIILLYHLPILLLFFSQVFTCISAHNVAIGKSCTRRKWRGNAKSKNPP